MDIERAIIIACEAHAGQTDKAGEPYILHPLRVMLCMATDEQRIVAVLHDVVEDSPLWGIARLEAEGFSRPVVDAIRCLTRMDGEPYLASFIGRCGSNPLARAVKIADILDNGNEGRLAKLPDTLAERLRTKYRAALVTLGYDQP